MDWIESANRRCGGIEVSFVSCCIYGCAPMLYHCFRCARQNTGTRLRTRKERMDWIESANRFQGPETVTYSSDTVLGVGGTLTFDIDPFEAQYGEQHIQDMQNQVTTELLTLLNITS